MAGQALLVAVAGSFICQSPTHHDGDNVRCRNIEQAIRLEGIDAPEMPGACRPGRFCTPGDPYAARDYLRRLTSGRTLECQAIENDDYGRIIARCMVGGVDLSCAMIESGHAVPRYAAIACGTGSAVTGAAPPVTRVVPDQQAAHGPAPAPAAPARSGLATPLLLALWLLAVNLATWFSFATDKARAERYQRRFHPEPRIPESTLLGLALLGGSPAAWAAMQHFRHKTAKASFRLRLLLISGLQLGAMIGALWWWVAG
jgi:uncharacterized membrane protein YsdA (DUF1294 family)/endonuclease YncB( thermonuclease family)